jgi:hypothetical protein
VYKAVDVDDDLEMVTVKRGALKRKMDCI